MSCVWRKQLTEEGGKRHRRFFLFLPSLNHFCACFLKDILKYQRFRIFLNIFYAVFFPSWNTSPYLRMKMRHKKVKQLRKKRKIRRRLLLEKEKSAGDNGLPLKWILLAQRKSLDQNDFSVLLHWIRLVQPFPDAVLCN